MSTENESKKHSNDEMRQYSTFYIGERLYGIDVMQVQEVTKAMNMTRIPLAPDYVHGLINLRGQIATAVALRNLFELREPPPDIQMNVVCRTDGLLLSFLVDRIGDVVEVPQNIFEPPPDTVPLSVKRFMQGVYKTPGQLLSIIEVGEITKALIKNVNTSAI